FRNLYDFAHLKLRPLGLDDDLVVWKTGFDEQLSQFLPSILPNIRHLVLATYDAGDRALLPHFRQLTSVTVLDSAINGLTKIEKTILEALKSMPNLKRLEWFSGNFTTLTPIAPILARLEHFG